MTLDLPCHPELFQFNTTQDFTSKRHFVIVVLTLCTRSSVTSLLIFCFTSSIASPILFFTSSVFMALFSLLMNFPFFNVYMGVAEKGKNGMSVRFPSRRLVCPRESRAGHRLMEPSFAVPSLIERLPVFRQKAVVVYHIPLGHTSRKMVIRRNQGKCDSESLLTKKTSRTGPSIQPKGEAEANVRVTVATGRYEVTS